jgi:hypothetical protein
MASKETVAILWQCVNELREMRGAPPLPSMPRPKLRVIEGGETWVRDPEEVDD